MDRIVFPRIDGQSANLQAHSRAWKSVYERITTQKHKAMKSRDHINIHKEHVISFMQQSFIIPQTWLTQREQLTQSIQTPPLNKILSSHNPLLSMAEYQGEVFGKYVKNTESKMQSEEKKRVVITKKLIDMHEDNEKLQDNITMLSAKYEALHLKRYHTEEKLQHTEEKLDKLRTDLAEIKTAYNPRNVK